MTESSEAIDACTRQLEAIGAALARYRNRRHRLPDRLQDLCPRFLPDASLFCCPADPESSKVNSGNENEPERAGSYHYEMNRGEAPPFGVLLGPGRLSPHATWRDRKEAQQIHFGARVPVVRCSHHGDVFLNLTLQGQVYRSGPAWEWERETREAVLQRMMDALDAGKFLEEWAPAAAERYLFGWLYEMLPPGDRLRFVDAGERLQRLTDARPGDQQLALMAARFLAAGGPAGPAIALCERWKDRRRQPNGARSLYHRFRGERRLPSLRSSVLDFLEAERERHQVPGLSAVVARDGEIVLAEGLGFADLENRTPATAETVYQIGSITKQFTAVTLRMLEQEDRLSLKDPITRHLDGLPDTWKGVTLWHLLTHTSGIKSYTSLPGFMRTVRRDFRPEEIIALVRDEPLDFEPGEKLSYNNTAYFLLGLVIEARSGRSYGDYLQERIFGPLEMTATRVNDRGLLIPHRARGYSLNGTEVENAEFVSPTQPFSAGVLLSNVLDLVKWDNALYTDRLLPQSVLQEMWQRIHLNDGAEREFGQGWVSGEYRGHHQVGHGGGIHGFVTFCCRFPEERLMVAVLTNADFDDPASMAFGAADRFLPEREPPQPPDSALLKKISRAPGRPSSSTDLYAPAVLEQLQSKASTRFYQSLGRLRRTELVDVSGDAWTLRSRFDNGIWNHRVRVDNGKVVELGVQPA